MTLPAWLLLVTALLATAVMLSQLARRIHLPATVVLALTGFLAGWLGEPLGVVNPLQAHAFEEVVTFLFLPVLVFQAAIGVSVRAFFRNLLPILVLAIPALAVAATVVGAGLHWILGLPLAAALVFGVLISATDPVAVVAVFRQLGVPERLLTLVEGESLLNDGVAIVLFNILLAAALGAEAGFPAGIWSFAKVFFGGLLIGSLLGFGIALLLPWLPPLPATALTLATAYGGFVLAEHVLGFSGVMATVSAGVAMAGLAPSRGTIEIRDAWAEFWETSGYVANSLLFLLIGLALDPMLIGKYYPAILLALAAVLIARAVAVIPLVALVERAAKLPPVGRRNAVVLVWGGLRGGVALALALSLPGDLAQRELLVAMTGGVVLGTLVLNATTIEALVRRLGLTRPSRAHTFLCAGAELMGVRAARDQLRALGAEAPAVFEALAAAEDDAKKVLATIRLDAREELQVVLARGLYVERDTYQRLSDGGLLPPPVARALLHEVDDHIERIAARGDGLALRERHISRFDRVVEKLVARMPPPAGDDPTELAYAEASARRLGARRAIDSLHMLEELPNVQSEVVTRTRATFQKWEREARATLAELDETATVNLVEVQRRQADALSRIAAREALHDLARLGLLPDRLAVEATALITEELRRAQKRRRAESQ